MYLYCIQCGHMDEVYQGTHRKIVIHENEIGHWLEWKECDGPFAFDGPPVTNDDGNQIEPDADELSMMNENASLLLADMEM